MPVKRRTIGAGSPGVPAALVEELVQELKGAKEFGQPLVEVETFPRTGLVGVTVVWDKLGPLSDSQRSALILEAYTRAYGGPGPDNVAFAIGMTMAEAADAGKLPYTILPLLRASDGITPDQVHAVISDFGGMTLPGGDVPEVLRFATLEEAEACRTKLIEQLPGSDAVWTITKEVHSPDWARG